MGAEPWNYFVPYEPNIQSALGKLRQQEFAAGRFRGSELNPTSIEEACKSMDADGTASILDIERISDDADYSTVYPLSASELKFTKNTETHAHWLISFKKHGQD